MSDECCPHHDGLTGTLQKIEEKIDQILYRLSQGDTSLALLGARVGQVEERTKDHARILGWAGMLIVGAVLAAVLKTVIIEAGR
jgi:hypothetical protein